MNEPVQPNIDALQQRAIDALNRSAVSDWQGRSSNPLAGVTIDCLSALLVQQTIIANQAATIDRLEWAGQGVLSNRGCLSCKVHEGEPHKEGSCFVLAALRAGE